MSATKIMFADLETENHPYFGAVASPRHPDNYVVAIGQSVEERPFSGEITGRYFHSKEESRGKWLSIPDDVWLLVAHNATFELDWMLSDGRQEIMKFLARGGRVYCTAYGHYLLSNQQDYYPTLNDIAPQYGGTPKVDGIKILWEQGYLTSQIDKALLFDEYLLGPSGDIENTRKSFYGQVALLQERGMWDMALARCEGLVFNAFAMNSGLHVDRGVAWAQKETAERRLAELSSTMKEWRTHIPEAVGFKETSDFHMSAWLFGGPIRYREKDTWYEDDGVTPKYEKDDFYKFADGTRIPAAHFNEDTESEPGLAAERAKLAVDAHGPVEKYKSGKNKGQPKVFREDTDTPKTKWYDRVLNVGPVIDLAKMPKELRDTFLRENTGKRKHCDESLVVSTGADAIEALAKRPEFEYAKPLLDALLEYAKVDKDLGTYYLREECDSEGNVVKQSGMLQYLTESNVVYHNLNCTSTVTGRLSSNRPNMQNVPRGDTSDVKNMFTSRFDDPVWLELAVQSAWIPRQLYELCMQDLGNNGAILEADYSALEVVALAAFSKDSALCQALLEGIDMHCMRLSKMLGEPYVDVLSKCKDENHPEHKAYKTLRTDIKPRAFAYQYGATAHGIAFATGCSVEEAQTFIDTEKALFPEVEEFYERLTRQVESNVTRHREEFDSGQWRVYCKGVWVAPGGTHYEFRQHPKVQYVDGRRMEVMQFKPTQIRNYPIQGEAGFFVQGIAGQVMRWLVSRNFFDGKVFIINQVHDAYYLDVHKSVLEEVAVSIKSIMESLPEFFKQYGYDLGLPFPAEVEAGPNMNDKRKVA